MSRTRHASASREKQGSSSAAGQLPVYLMWIPCPNAEKYVPHSSIVNVIWQPVVTALVGSRMSITHFAEVSSEQSALA